MLSFNYSELDLDLPLVQPIASIYKLLNQLWEGAPISEEWTKGNLSPVFKKGDATDPNNWHPVCLLDCTYKLLAPIIASRMNPNIRNDGLEEQCRCLKQILLRRCLTPQNHPSTPKKTQPRKLCTLRKPCQSFQYHQPSTYVDGPEKYGFPPKMIETIRKMYEQFVLKFQKGEELVSIEYLTCVCQGGSLDPLLPITVSQAAMEPLEKYRRKETNTNSKIENVPKYCQSKTTRKRLRGQHTQSKGTEFPHWIPIYINNSVFILPTRDDTSKTANLALKHLWKFGLQTHTGSEKKKSKNKVLHILNKSS